MNIPFSTTILKSKIETTDVKTITFNYPGAVQPGQFYMVWIPGVDEIPMSVSESSLISVIRPSTCGTRNRNS